MPDDPAGNASPADRSTADDGSAVVDAESISDADGDAMGVVKPGAGERHVRDATGAGACPPAAGDIYGDDNALPDAGADTLGIGAVHGDSSELGVELSPWAPLHDLLDATEPEVGPDDRPFASAEGVGGGHALELRAESMLFHAERGAERTGKLDRTEVGHSDDNRDVVAGRDEVAVDGMLDEHTGHGYVVVTDEVETNVGGPLTMHAHLEDNIVMAGTMRDEFRGGTFVTAAMSDDLAAGAGVRCTAPLDLWVLGLLGVEERPGTCAADLILSDFAGTLYEREYGPSVHAAAVARFQNKVTTTMKSGFRPLMKTALGVRNLIPGGAGGGGGADVSPPAAPPAPGGEASGATLSAAEGGGALGRGAGGGVDTDEFVSLVRTVENASDSTDVESLQQPASTADNLDALTRVEVEGGGYQQIAEIYDQPVPAVETSSGPDAAAPGAAATRREPPPLELAEPGTEGYDFHKAYGSLSDRNRFYRRTSNWRGNIFLRDYLGDLEAKAVQLLTDLGGSAGGITSDGSSFRTANIHTTLDTMAGEAEMAGRLEDLANIRAAMDEIEGLLNGTIAEVAARTDEFSGAALGSQHALVDPNIDTDKLRRWLDEQFLMTQERLPEVESIVDPTAREKASQQLTLEAAYWLHLRGTLDQGLNPLADSAGQIALMRVETVEPYYAQFADEIADAAAEGYELVVPRLPQEDQIDLYLQLQNRLLDSLSDPTFHRGFDEMGADAFTPAVRARIEAGDAFLGPDALRSPPSSPPPPLDVAEPGAAGYDFRKAFDALENRNRFYRDEFNFRGHLYTREYLRELDAKGFELLAGLGGSADDVTSNFFGHHTPSIYDTLSRMAGEAEAAGDLSRAADIRAAMGEMEKMVSGTLAEVAIRTGEFSGASIDRSVDTVRLRGWLQDQAHMARDLHMAAATDEAGQRAAWEWGYYLRLVQALDEGVDPLAVSNEMIAARMVDEVDPYYAQFADEVADAAAEGVDLAIDRPRAEDEVELYVRLQDVLLDTLSDPAFHRRTSETGADGFIAVPRSRSDPGPGFLARDSLRRLAGGEVPPPLPAAQSSGAVYIDEIRDRSFARSALAASEDTLQRQAANLAEADPSIRSPSPEPDSALPEPSPVTRRAPPDNAGAPSIDERSGGWVRERSAEPGASPSPTDGSSTSTRGRQLSSREPEASWESGLQVSDDSDVGSAAVDVDASPFDTPSAPEDAVPEDVGALRQVRTGNDDGSSGSRNARSIGARGEDGNPTGRVSGPDDLTTTPGRGAGTGDGP